MPVTFTKDPLPVINEGERHVPAVVLADGSDSMSGGPMNELNEGLKMLGSALAEDPLACGRAEVCILSFNSRVNTEVSFRPASEYEAPRLKASGLTALNEAIIAGLDAIEARKQEYRANGVSWYRPWLFVLTDGAPTDTEKESEARARLQKAIQNKKVVYMPMAIGQYADVSKLQSYYPDVYVDEEGREKAKIVLKADKNHFKEAFVWLSNSLSVISSSDPTTESEVKLPPMPSVLSIGIS